jgi:hypothetical protein
VTICLLQAAQGHVHEVGVETAVDALQQIVIHRQDEAIEIAMMIAIHDRTKRSENAGFPLKFVISFILYFNFLIYLKKSVSIAFTITRPPSFWELRLATYSMFHSHSGTAASPTLHSG